VFEQGRCWIKLSGPYRIAKHKPLSSLRSLGQSLVATRPDRLLWGSDWPHLPNGQRDTGELINLLADWAPDQADRHQILVTSPDHLFFAWAAVRGSPREGDARDAEACCHPRMGLIAKRARAPRAR
jgi:predicted TIM-barrel fold metal-dependent hydrolase